MIPAQRIRELNRAVIPSAIAASEQLYLAELDLSDSPDWILARDLSYGPDDRQRLDVFGKKGSGASAPRPILMFVHGGGFVAGAKRKPGLPYYDNIGIWAARAGYVGINVTYRLAPAHPWPAGGEDVAAAIDWVRHHGAEYGGDPGIIIIFGHSAGAAHVAAAVAMQSPDRQPAIAGAIVLSGLYDVSVLPRAPNLEAYFGPEPSVYRARSPLQALAQSPVPLLIGFAQYEPATFQMQALSLASEAISARPDSVRLIQVQGHNHMSEVHHISSDDRRLTDVLSAFIDECRRA